MRRDGRLHAPALDALADPPTLINDRPVIYLRAPQPGIFVPAVDDGNLVAAGSAIGELIVLGRSIAVIASGVSGFAHFTPDGAHLRRRAVAYGDLLFALDLSGDRLPGGLRAAGAADRASSQPAPGATGLVFRAPTSGRYYGRSAPDKPPFVTPGMQLTTGATICLIEVMKTFSRVTYGGPGLPESARVVRVLVAEGADVNAGEPLLALD
jgi:acetyl-CoA carboxylase biotin carboxyl carrier protein